MKVIIELNCSQLCNFDVWIVNMHSGYTQHTVLCSFPEGGGGCRFIDTTESYYKKQGVEKHIFIFFRCDDLWCCVFTTCMSSFACLPSPIFLRLSIFACLPLSVYFSPSTLRCPSVRYSIAPIFIIFTP